MLWRCWYLLKAYKICNANSTRMEYMHESSVWNNVVRLCYVYVFGAKCTFSWFYTFLYTDTIANVWFMDRIHARICTKRRLTATSRMYWCVRLVSNSCWALCITNELNSAPNDACQGMCCGCRSRDLSTIRIFELLFVRGSNVQRKRFCSIVLNGDAAFFIFSYLYGIYKKYSITELLNILGHFFYFVYEYVSRLGSQS